LPGALSVNPFAINNAGDVVGYSFDGTFTSAILYKNGQPRVLGGLPGFEAHVATGISDSGLVVGYSSKIDANGGFFGQHAWILDKGVFTDLGTFSGDDTQPYDVNNRGQVAGTVRGGGLANRAFLWDEKSGVTELWDNGGAGSGGLNARGDFVDGGIVLLGGAQAPLLSLIGPNTGWEGLLGYDINNQQTMVGLGYRDCGGVVGQCPGRAFLMRRVDEPDAAALLGLALAGLAVSRRRMRKRESCA
jgi:probable HAF family extracellular repeat protein